MNFKLVLRTYSQLRQLTDDETALLNTLRGMSDAEREMTVEAFGGSMGKVGKGAVSKKLKQFKKCDVCGISKRAAHHRDVNHRDYHEFDSGGQAGATEQKKSKRASELAEKLQKPLGQGVKADEYEDDPTEELCAKCEQVNDANVHHQRTFPNYHPFVPAAQDADESSSPMNGSSRDDELSTASSEVERESASTATGG